MVSSGDDSGNSYLDQVVAEQAALEGNLRSRRAARPVAQPMAAAAAPPVPGSPSPLAKRAARSGGGAAPVAPAPGPVDVRISGMWRWKTVIVPPNAFVVHTRRGRAEPLHV